MSTWKDKKKGYWRYGFQFLGKRCTGSGYKDRREAETAEKNRREEEAEAQSRRKKTGTSFYEASKLYLDHAERRFVKKTYDYKATVLSRFLAYIGAETDIKSITPGDIMSFLQTRTSNNSYNVHRKELSALFTFMRRYHRESLDINPCTDVETMPHTAKAKAIPSEEDILRLIMATDPETDECDLFLCCLHTLGRIDELLRLTWRDVNFESRIITLWTRKRKGGAYEADPLSMNKDLYDVLHSRWKARKQERWVFYNEKTETRYNHRPKFMAGLCKRAGLDPIGKSRRKIGRGKNKGKYREANLYFGFHNIRHFMASYLADKGKVGTQAISKLLRHKSVKTTEIYLHSVDESQRVAMAGVEGKFTKKLTECDSAPTLGKGVET